MGCPLTITMNPQLAKNFLHLTSLKIRDNKFKLNANCNISANKVIHQFEIK